MIKKTTLNKIQSDFPNGIKKCLMISPPDADESLFSYQSAKRKRYLNFPPYGLGLLANIARKYSIQVEIKVLQTSILDSVSQSNNVEEFDYNSAWQSVFTNFDYDAICITCMFSQTHTMAKLVGDYIYKNSKKTIPILMGGVHVTNMYIEEKTRTKLLEDFSFADYFFLWEADAAFESFLLTINKGVVNLAQLYIRDCEGGAGEFLERIPPNEEHLNSIPAWDLMNPREHSKNGKVGAFYFLRGDNPITATVLANRGCRAQCTFCSVRNFNGVGVRRRTIDSVISELEILQYEYGVQHIMWLDDDFFYNTEETMRLFNEMVKRKINITWDCSNGVIASSCSQELLMAARDAGCLGLIIGMESGSRKILRQIKKPGTVETFLKAAENLRAVPEIHSRVFLMIGFPNETYGDIMETYEVARKMNLDWHNIAPLQPLPNTPIYKSMLDQGLITDIDTKDVTKLRFNSGAYSVAVEKSNKSQDLLSLDFKEAFNNDPSLIPSKADLDLIWGYMNYHLNYDRLNYETRDIKSNQAMLYLCHISDSIAPDNAIALYYKLKLKKDRKRNEWSDDLTKLNSILETNAYWLSRFKDFNLSVDDFKVH